MFRDWDPSWRKDTVMRRDSNGPFRSRKLLKVPRLGPKAFEQAAGFLRIRDGRIPWMPAPSTRKATL